MSVKNDFLHSSKSSTWQTPDWLFEALNNEFEFTIDVCASSENKKCERFYSESNSCFNYSWEDERCFMNPPYGKDMYRFLQKAYTESKRNATVVCVLPVRPDSKWWQDFVMKAEIRYFRQRLKFTLDGKRSDVAPFATAIVVFKPLSFKETYTDIIPLFSYGESLGGRQPLFSA